VIPGINSDEDELLSLNQTLEQTAGEPEVDPFASYPVPVQREIERLTDLLFFPRSNSAPRQIVLIEMDPAGRSSLWLASGIASVLCSALRQTVYVLSVNSADSSKPSGSRQISQSNPSVLSSSYFIERISESGPRGDLLSVLTERLLTLQRKGYPVIIHLPYDQHSGFLTRAKSVEGVVLLTRASHTRRAALQSMERSLASANIPLLGSVLLDRVHPIPERLYRIL
jgi:hypothetical protein